MIYINKLGMTFSINATERSTRGAYERRASQENTRQSRNPELH